ncbi:Nucleotide-diphospho-sugar transferase [Thiovulum sp. ES]|nr:Nucleotide-diphospho-sugar transferase [Thiovulum sp. ES]
MKVVFFYTDDKLYSQHAKLLELSLKKLGIDYFSKSVSANEWQNIIAFKPQFILEMREKFRGDLVYIDADAFVHSDFRPNFENITEDIGVHYLKDEELISATIFMKDSEKTLNFMQKWVEKQKANPEIWDQKVMQETIEEFDISVKKLSPEYTFITDITKERYADEVGKPIIEHLQASRESRYKKKNQKFLRKIFGIKKKPNHRLLFRRNRVKELSKSVNMEFEIE